MTRYHGHVPSRPQRMPLHLSRPPLAGLAIAALSLAVATVLASLIRYQLGVPHAATVYLLAVVAVGMGYGSWMAVAKSAG